MPRVHAFTDDALRDLDAVGVVRALHAGEVSAPEVVDAAIARTEAVDPELGAVAWRSWDRARAEAGALRGGFFAGVPTFVKDNVDVAGMPTLQGTDAYVGTPAVRDGDFARMYLATGLVALGKTRLSEYGFNAACEHPRLGPVRNPWDPTRTAGASSAGSAALVAAGAVPIAHANDGGGSIRIPAAVNGLVGLKPTRGRLAQDAMLRGQPVRIVSDGVVTRSVRDTAALFREAEKVYRPLKLPPIGDITRPGKQRLRVAVHTGGAGRSADAETIAATWRTATLLEELGHHVEEDGQLGGVQVGGAGQRAQRVGTVRHGVRPALAGHEPAQVLLAQQPGGQPVAPFQDLAAGHQRALVVTRDAGAEHQGGEGAAEDRVVVGLAQAGGEAGGHAVPEPAEQVVVDPAGHPGRQGGEGGAVAQDRVRVAQHPGQLSGEVPERSVGRYGHVVGQHLLPVAPRDAPRHGANPATRRRHREPRT